MWNVIVSWSLIYVCGVTGQFMAPGTCPHKRCTNVCPMGYILDAKGCTTCTCSTTHNTGSPMNPGGDPFHHGGAQMGHPGSLNTGSRINTSPIYNRPCIHDAPCGITNCPGGFFNGPGGCQFCICSPGKTSQTAYSNPCSSAPSTCDAVCYNGFTTGSNGCHYCECATNTSANVDSTTQIPTTPIMSKEDICMAKITDCQLLHPYGFMTDNDCTMCVGKDEIYKISNIPEERQPIVKLSNPCIMGFDVCRIFCASGYKVGPRSCQYCACKNDKIWVP